MLEMAHLTHNCVKIPDDPEVITREISRAIRAGRYEKDEMRGLPKFLDASDRVVELGSGLGFISAFLGVHLGLTRTLCVEANPALAPFIRRTHALNNLDGISVQTGVALPGTPASGSTLPFYVRDPFWASSLTKKGAHKEIVEVPALSLTDLLVAQKATTLIVDIEGGEATIFDGLDTGPVEKIYLELHTRYIGQRGIKKTFDDLSALGFWYDQKVSSGGSVLFRKLT